MVRTAPRRQKSVLKRELVEAGGMLALLSTLQAHANEVRSVGAPCDGDDDAVPTRGGGVARSDAEDPGPMRGGGVARSALHAAIELLCDSEAAKAALR
mgnify:CR=1 FL=1